LYRDISLDNVRISQLQKDYPWHDNFLKWHNEQIKRYSGPERAELWTAARDWVSKDIRLEHQIRTKRHR
jgi:hypothetical protein